MKFAELMRDEHEAGYAEGYAEVKALLYGERQKDLVECVKRLRNGESSASLQNIYDELIISVALRLQ